MVRHIVVLKYKADATAEQIRTITDAFAALKDLISGITAFEHGPNTSPEGIDQGFTYVYQLTFADTAARDAYIPHPEHKKFGEMVVSSDIFEDVFVVDYAPEA